MADFKGKAPNEKERILDDVVTILEGMSSGWEMQFEGSIGPETFLGANLGLKSVDLVRLVAAIQKHYHRQDLPFQELFFPDDPRVEDLQVSDLVDFLHRHLNHP